MYPFTILRLLFFLGLDYNTHAMITRYALRRVNGYKKNLIDYHVVLNGKTL